jgi:hypothetical protein
MKNFEEADDPRRRLLVQALVSGFFAAGFTPLPVRPALVERVFCGHPAKLPPEQSIYCLSGTVLVKGEKATLNTQIRPGDILETGGDGELIFVVGDNAMLLRRNSKLLLVPGVKDQAPLLFVDINLIKGSLLAVCGPGRRQVHTDTAKIVLVGTGFYAESDPERTYFCTCYGRTEVTAKDDPGSKETVEAIHHNRPLNILGGAKNRGKSILKAAFVRHTDEELRTIETLVGRIPPFMR